MCPWSGCVSAAVTPRVTPPAITLWETPQCPALSTAGHRKNSAWLWAGKGGCCSQPCARGFCHSHKPAQRWGPSQLSPKAGVAPTPAHSRKSTSEASMAAAFPGSPPAIRSAGPSFPLFVGYRARSHRMIRVSPVSVPWVIGGAGAGNAQCVRHMETLTQTVTLPLLAPHSPTRALNWAMCFPAPREARGLGDSHLVLKVPWSPARQPAVQAGSHALSKHLLGPDTSSPLGDTG